MNLPVPYPPISDPTGYVVYGHDMKGECPLGIVCHDHERKALCAWIPDYVKKYLVAIEDKRFYQHFGIDLRSIARAIYVNTRQFKIVQGGSTITQQLARNLLRNNAKTFSRKFREMIYAFYLERKNSKEELLTKYIDNVYWGKNLFGLRAASLGYFNKEPHTLKRSELLFLITLLRGPNFYAKHPEVTQKRFVALNDLLYKSNIISKKTHISISRSHIVVKPRELKVYNADVIRFISQGVNVSRKIIYSSIDPTIQQITDEYVCGSKYPTSIIILVKGKITGFSSTFGNGHVFNFRTNVGSALKPFLFTFFTENQCRGLNFAPDWQPRDISPIECNLLSDALFYSRNHEFVKAGYAIGMEKTLNFLANVLQIDRSYLFPSSILGATSRGISIYELAKAYHRYFQAGQPSIYKKQTLTILEKIARYKFEANLKAVYLKTGTTNSNKERLAVGMDKDMVFAILRENNPADDLSKEGNFLTNIFDRILNPLTKYFHPKAPYKWI